MAAVKRRRKVARIQFEEPSVEGWDKLTEDERNIKVRDWAEIYREFHGPTKLKFFYYKWVDKNIAKIDIPAARAGAPMVTHLLGSWARMIDQGYGTEYYTDALNRLTQEIVEYGRMVLSETTKEIKGEVKKGYRPSIQEAIAEQTGWIIGEIEGEVDDLIVSGKSKFDLYKFLQKKEVKGPHNKRIQTYLSTMLLEIEEMIAETDDDLEEGYDFMSKSLRKKYLKFVEKMIKDADSWSNVLKAKRKPRTKKSMSIQQKTANVKYKERDDAYKIVSVSPSKIVDAYQVWLFNTKDRFLYRYVSKNGMSIKGSTLKDWDEVQSFKKKIRKPDVTLPDVIGGGKVKLRKLMDNIKAKEGKVTGRINKDMIILRVV